MASRGQQDTVMKTRNPEDNAPGKTGQWKDVDLDGVRVLLNVAQIKDMTNSGTAGKQYVMPNTPHVISLLGRVDKNILGTSPLRVRRKTGWWRRRLSLQSLLVRVEGDPLSTQYAQRRSFQATEEEEEEEEEEGGGCLYSWCEHK